MIDPVTIRRFEQVEVTIERKELLEQTQRAIHCQAEVLMANIVGIEPLEVMVTALMGATGCHLVEYLVRKDGPAGLSDEKFAAAAHRFYELLRTVADRQTLAGRA